MLFQKLLDMKKHNYVRQDYCTKGEVMTENTKIGLDFGTTYSVLSRLKKGKDGHVEPEACALREGGSGAEIQDSIVLKDQNAKLFFGSSARNKVGRKRTTAYTGFKIMLAETDQEILRQRNYDETYTPERITSEYIKDLLTKYRDTENSQQLVIDKLVVGVPEIWFESTRTIDCRKVLKDMIKSIDGVREVEIVSEPAAACAYFVHNYFIKKQRKYKGRILIVDYGGGTLDIALCEVTENGGSNDVKVVERAGAGWNTQQSAGRAGLAFMEEIVKTALKQAGLEEAQIASDQVFYRNVQYIEQDLMNGVESIKRTFQKKVFEEPENITDIFSTIEYRDDEYDVTYGMIAQAYNRVIRDLLDGELNKIIRYMDKKGIDYSGEGEEDDFKIALAGGFCNFYLTEKQIRDKFKDVAEDRRFQDIQSGRRDCEKAVSYGAALIANGVVEFKSVAPYSLGFASRLQKDKPWYAIHKGEDIEYGSVKMFLGPDGRELLFQGSAIPLIVFNFDDDPEYAEAREPLPEFQKKLNLEKDKIYKFGYSLDQSMVITLHKWVVPKRQHPEVTEDEETVVLENIYKMMGDLIAIGGER